MISKTRAQSLAKGLHEDEEQVQERLDALGLFAEAALPELKEGLSLRLDNALLPETIVNEAYERTTTHMIHCEENDELIVKPFSQANAYEKELIKQFRYNLIDATKDKLTLLQQAATSEGLLVIIPAHTIIKEPITLTSTYEKNGFAHLLIIAKTGSVATINRIINENTKTEEKGLVCEIGECYVDECATLTYNEHQNLSKTTAFYVQKKARLGPKSTMNWYSHNTGSSLNKQNIVTNLEGHQAHCTNLLTVWMDEKQQADINATITHKAAKTTSGMYAKGVVGNTAKFLHRGLITIGDEAKDAEGYQQEDVLLLDEAQADALPKLDINNHEVQCSHGATIGSIDEEQLYYLRSRGLESDVARKLITKGFLNSIKNYTDNTLWQEQINEILHEENNNE